MPSPAVAITTNYFPDGEHTHVRSAPNAPVLDSEELTGPTRNSVVRSGVVETIARRIAFAAAPASWTGS
jgi:hypothetical protein